MWGITVTYWSSFVLVPFLLPFRYRSATIPFLFPFLFPFWLFPFPFLVVSVPDRSSPVPDLPVHDRSLIFIFDFLTFLVPVSDRHRSVPVIIFIIIFFKTKIKFKFWILRKEVFSETNIKVEFSWYLLINSIYIWSSKAFNSTFFH